MWLLRKFVSFETDSSKTWTRGTSNGVMEGCKGRNPVISRQVIPPFFHENYFWPAWEVSRDFEEGMNTDKLNFLSRKWTREHWTNRRLNTRSSGVILSASSAISIALPPRPTPPPTPFFLPLLRQRTAERSIQVRPISATNSANWRRSAQCIIGGH